MRDFGYTGDKTSIFHKCLKLSSQISDQRGAQRVGDQHFRNAQGDVENSACVSMDSVYPCKDGRGWRRR